MRVCIEKATNKVIEVQSGGETSDHLDTLKQNAIKAGFSADAVEVKFVTDQEYQALLDADVGANAEKVKNEAKGSLVQIDLQSIRSIREWLANQPTCPDILKGHEEKAKEERSKLTA